MPRVAYFSNQFAAAEGHGLARYARELYAALREQGSVDVMPVAAWSSLARPELDILKSATGMQLTGLGRRLTPLAWTFLGGPPLERLLGTGFDVVHAVSLGYPVATRKPLVVTIHDLGPLTHPDFFSNTRPWVMQRSLEQARRQADVIVCVSRSTADEVTGYLGDGIADRIRVVHEGVSSDFFELADASCLSGLNLPPADVPFILSAGKISPRKNVQGLLRALARIKDSIPHHLALVGGLGWDTRSVQCELAATRIGSRVHLLGFVRDDQLRALYQMAAAYVHPSLYEGFGLTVLEAMAAGAPVIASNTSALPEVAGEAARLVDPIDDRALAEAIYEVCSDAALAARMAEQGRSHAARFSWSASASAMIDIYREAEANRRAGSSPSHLRLG